MSAPRLITASEILAERAALRKELGYIPHGTGRGWSSMFWVYCDCPNCRDNYDPTGEESAKYLNMDSTSFFRKQSDTPSFAFSKIAKESFFYASKEGYYLDEKRLELDELLSHIMSGASLSTILHICKDGTWDELVLSNDTTKWTQRTHRGGKSVYYKESEGAHIPYESSHDALCEYLKTF